MLQQILLRTCSHFPQRGYAVQPTKHTWGPGVWKYPANQANQNRLVNAVATRQKDSILELEGQLTLVRAMAKDCRVITFDLETTGLIPAKSYILQIGAQDLERETHFNELIKPMMGRRVIEIPSNVIKVHGITNNKVASCQPFQQVATRFIEWLEWQQGAPIFLIAHNGDVFDEPCFRREALQNSIPIPSNIIFLDSLHLLKNLCPDLSNHKLSTLAARYGTSYNSTKAHDALEDARTLTALLKDRIVDTREGVVFYATQTLEKRIAKAKNGAGSNKI